MAKNKFFRVCEKYWLYNEENNTTNYCLVGLTWHSSKQAAQKYYSKHHETKKKDLMWSEHGTGIAFSPLYPRLAKS